MKMIIKNNRLFLVLSFFALSFSGIAQDTIRLFGGKDASRFDIVVNEGKQFTVDWGNGDILTYIGTGERQSLNYYYPFGEPYEYWMTIAGSEIDCKFIVFWSGSITVDFDASKAPSLKHIDLRDVTARLRSITLSNCSALENLNCSSINGVSKLKYLDLSDCISLKTLNIDNTALSTLDVSNTALEKISMMDCKFPLSQIYPISLKANPAYFSCSMRQRLDQQRPFIGDVVDFSSEREFGGIATTFMVYKGDWENGSPIPPGDIYSLKDGLITFHTGGTYTVKMTNFVMPAFSVYVLIYVSTPVEEIINVPTTAIAGKMIYLTGVVKPYNAPNKIIWSIYDAGTTGATIISTSLYTTDPGTVIVTATIKDGKGTGIDYVQNFSIEVKPLSIEEGVELSGIKVYPNPTTGELRIENGELRIINVEIVDVYGKILSSHHLITSSSHHLINIAHLPAGNYFVKIITEQGEVVKKVVKQ